MAGGDVLFDVNGKKNIVVFGQGSFDIQLNADILKLCGCNRCCASGCGVDDFRIWQLFHSLEGSGFSADHHHPGTGENLDLSFLLYQMNDVANCAAYNGEGAAEAGGIEGSSIPDGRGGFLRRTQPVCCEVLSVAYVVSFIRE